MKELSNIEYNGIQNVIFSKKQHELVNLRQYKMSLLYNRTIIEKAPLKKQHKLVNNVRQYRMSLQYNRVVKGVGGN